MLISSPVSTVNGTRQPATGYGYIRVGNALPPPPGVKAYKTVFHRAEQFVEKPHFDKALEYLNSGQFRWNAGMFIWSFVTITEGLQKHQPEMYEACQRWFKVAGNPAKLNKVLAKEYPDIWADEVNIDAICMWMFKNPQDYSVLVAENMFGDIVSDLCAGLVGGLGFAPSANLGDNYAVFEPTHGSAPKYAGQYKVNPIAMLLTAKLMLDWLKETEMATRLESAIARVIAEGKVRTYDMGGKASTLDVAKAIAEYASS